MNTKDISYYMDVAERTALQSYARRMQVGAVIVSTDRLMAMGYNGTPAGWDNGCEDESDDGSLTTKPEVIHAEKNALYKCLNNGVPTKGATMFLTLAPCIECSKDLHLANIERVYYRDVYRSMAGVEFLRKCGIPCIRWDDFNG
jgi:dCMP deaminase